MNGGYTFISSGEMITIVDNGKYKLIGDTIIINSDIQAEDLLRVKQWHVENLDTVYISINLLSGEELIGTNLILNDSIEYKLSDYENKTGIVKIKIRKINSIEVQSDFLPWFLNKTKYKIEGSNIVEIFLDDTKGFMRVFYKEDKYILNKTVMQSIAEKEILFTIQPNMFCDD